MDLTALPCSMSVERDREIDLGSLCFVLVHFVIYYKDTELHFVMLLNSVTEYGWRLTFAWNKL